MDIKNELELLQQKIDEAEAKGLSLNKYATRAIELLQQSLDEFKKRMAEQGRLDDDTEVARIEIRQYSAMRELSQKAGLPTEKYDKLIKDVQIRIFGEENWENFFGEQ